MNRIAAVQVISMKITLRHSTCTSRNGIDDTQLTRSSAARVNGGSFAGIGRGYRPGPDRRPRVGEYACDLVAHRVQNARMTIAAVLLDFYGTLARATRWISADEVLAEHGYRLDDEHRANYYADGLDGDVHDEHSRSRDHYTAWQRERTLAMLAASDVHPGEYELIIEKLHAGAADRQLDPYDEVADVLDELRRRDLRIVVCSNWDWDLREAVEESGLTDHVDAMVSSAWVGARKPHPRIFAAALGEAGVNPDAAIFVGDTWGPDVVGPTAAGMRPLYLRREGHWPDGTAPDPLDPDIAVAADLTGIFDLLDIAWGA